MTRDLLCVWGGGGRGGGVSVVDHQSVNLNW